SMWLSPEMSLYVMTPPLPLALTPELRIPRVPQRITEEVEAQDGQADRQTGKDREPGRLLHERAAGAAQHQAPRRSRRLGPDAEERERRLDQDGIAEPDRGDHEDRRRHVGQDVAQDDPRVAATHGLRRLHVAILLRGEHGATDDARVARN